MPNDTTVHQGASFAALCGQVAAGETFPRLTDLIRGCPFLRDDINRDAQAFAEDMLGQFGVDEDNDVLLFALAELSAAPTVGDFLIAATGFERAVDCSKGKLASQNIGAVRCYFYAAVLGHAASAYKVAAYAVSAAYARNLDAVVARSHCQSAVAWMLNTTGRLPLPYKWTYAKAPAFIAGVDAASGPGRQMVERMLESRTDALLDGGIREQPSASEDAVSGPAVYLPKLQSADSFRSYVTRTLEDDPNGPSAVVINAVGNDVSSEGRRVIKEFESVIGEALPLTPIPELAKIRRELAKEFPHAKEIIDVVLGPLSGMRYVKLPPTLFVGPVGCGKTSFAIRLAEVLELPLEVFNCCGVSDAALIGTPRRWSTGEASLPVSLVRMHRHAGPVVLLDELDKAATSRANGSLLDGLHALLDPRTAECFRDPYVEAPVNLVNVSWLATANSLEELPRSLTDRCRVLAFPPPKATHLEILTTNIVRRITLDLGLDPRWALPPDGTELLALSGVWKGGSLRSLERLVQAVLLSREHIHALN